MRIFGTDEPVPPAVELRAGPLRTTLQAGRLGAVFVDGHEVWHGVHFLLRDPHWRTPALQLHEARHEVVDDGWRVVVEGHFDVEPEVTLLITIEGHDDGTLVISAQAQAKGDIEVNRLGLCLLHPLAAAGRAVELRHDDGRVSRSTFPQLIPAWPPFTAISAMRHEYAHAAWASAEFDGDAFELEDQRNNADASFKTYSRSNFMPRPYRLRAGEVVQQQLRLRVESRPRKARALPTTALRWSAPQASGAAPMRIGVEVGRSDLAHANECAESLATMRPDHLHVSVSALDHVPGAALDAQALKRLLSAAEAGLRLDVLDMTAENARATLERLRDALRDAAVAPADIAVFPTTPETVAAARVAFPEARIGGGTPDFFVQLNRLERLPVLDFLSFTICPIVHAADDATVMRGHGSVQGMLDTLRARFGEVPVHLGPSRIAARRSPLGDLAVSDGRRRVPLAGVDPRDAADFGASWMAAHIAAAAQAGVQATTVSLRGSRDWHSPAGQWLARLGRRSRSHGLLVHRLAESHAVVALRFIVAEGVEDWLSNASGESSEVEFEPGGRMTLAPYALVRVPASSAAGE